MPAPIPSRFTTARGLAIAAIAACALLALPCGRAEAAGWESPHLVNAPVGGITSILASGSDAAGDAMLLAWVDLRFSLPRSARSRLPPGTAARLSLAIAAEPRDQSCSGGHPTPVSKHLKVKVVSVLSSPQAGVR